MNYINSRGQKIICWHYGIITIEWIIRTVFVFQFIRLPVLMILLMVIIYLFHRSLKISCFLISVFLVICLVLIHYNRFYGIWVVLSYVSEVFLTNVDVLQAALRNLEIHLWMWLILFLLVISCSISMSTLWKKWRKIGFRFRFLVWKVFKLIHTI